MNKKSVLLLALLLAILTSTTSVFAITDGTPDGEGHPYVGIMVAKDAAGNPLWRCSGTLLSPTVFLTAGHCTEAPAVTAEVWFDADMRGTAQGYPFTGQSRGTAYTHPDFNPNAFAFRDLGVVELDIPVYRSTYGVLPQLNQLDALKTRRGQQNQSFTAVGYGLQESFPDAASFQENNVRVRMVATPHLLQINVPGFTGDFSILLSNNASTGGTCFGDSGGPNFLGNTNIVAGVTSFGINGNCAGTGGVFRMDRSWSLDWVNSFLN